MSAKKRTARTCPRTGAASPTMAHGLARGPAAPPVGRTAWRHVQHLHGAHRCELVLGKASERERHGRGRLNSKPATASLSPPTAVTDRILCLVVWRGPLHFRDASTPARRTFLRSQVSGLVWLNNQTKTEPLTRFFAQEHATDATEGCRTLRHSAAVVHFHSISFLF